MKQNKIPEHYRVEGSFDIIDFNKAYDLNFNCGNIVKYLTRAGRKGSRLGDLLKAEDYIRREIEAERAVEARKLSSIEVIYELVKDR